MELFESIVALMGMAVLLLQISRKFKLPYPSLLALAGIGVALAPFLPTIVLDPQLALAIFVTPALFDAAYDTAPRELREHWLPLTMLAVAAVIVTTLTVGTVGHLMGHLGWAAALTLGAIVSPPDASAVSAVLSRFPLPRRPLLVLEGESLLNDATALLLFGTFQAFALHGGASIGHTIGGLALAVPGGALLGYLLGTAFLRVSRWTSGTLSASVAEIAVTFGAWIVAEQLHVSPILSVVVLAMTIARRTPSQQPARDRIHSVSLWGGVTFTLGALAFLLLGMQVLDVAQHLGETSLKEAILFGFAIFVVTVVTRVVWVFLYRAVAKKPLQNTDIPVLPAKLSFLVSWCGIRGILTIATASALPADFPSRSMIVFAAFSVVLGTLVVQGFTIGPLVKMLGIEQDDSLAQEAQEIRKELLTVGIDALQRETTSDAILIRGELENALSQAEQKDFSAESSSIDGVRRRLIARQRRRLIEMRNEGRIPEDAFQLIEEELDWASLAASPSNDVELEEI